ncbi:hypothetical protein [Nocardia sp. NPDC048505]|uniref:hypothetical protein n=1 Tax=unclassified Nocardia TaxID=2637762 RepID=UPI0034108CAB
MGSGGVEGLFVRFQAAAPNRGGWFPGVFALVNGLAWAGRLTEGQERYRQRENAWYRENLLDPSASDPAVYDREAHPGAAAWFKATAGEMISRVDGYTAILDAHGVGWTRLESVDPGGILYEDGHQIVVRPDHRESGVDAGTWGREPRLWKAALMRVLLV